MLLQQSSERIENLPEGVSSADPVPELEHVLGVDAEVDDLRAVGRKSHKMLGDSRLLMTILTKLDCVRLIDNIG